MDPCSRRQFLALASGGLLCGAAGVTPCRADPGRPLDVGTLADYPRDAISDKFIQHDVFVIRHEGRLFASTAICPHKANALFLAPRDPGYIACSGHDSWFTPDGIPLSGPARRPLVRFAISLNEQGRLLVDMSQRFPQNRWDDKACFVPVGPLES